MMDAKRIRNVSTKTTSQPLTQNSQQAPANLQNRYLCDHGPLRPGTDQSSKAAFGKSDFAKTCFLLLKI